MLQVLQICTPGASFRVMLHFRPTARGGVEGWVGMGGEKVCEPKICLLYLALYSNFLFSPEEVFFGFGWVGALAWVAWVRQIRPPPGQAHP